MLVALLMLSSCVGRTRTELLNESSDEEVANQKLSSILDCIENQDAESLKAMFSERALDESDYFEEDANLLFEFFKGKVVSWEKSSGPTVYTSVNAGKVIKEVDSYFYVKTDEQEYFFLINDYQQDDINAENEGLNMVLVVLAENRLDIYAQENEILFKDGEKISPPGIYLPIR